MTAYLHWLGWLGGLALLTACTTDDAVAVRRCAGLKMVEAGYFPDIAEELKGRTRAIAAA